MVYFALDRVVSYWYGLVEAGRVAEEVAVVGLVVGEFGVICVVGLDSHRIYGLDPRTFEYTNDAHEDIVVQDVLVETVFVQQYCGSKNWTERRIHELKEADLYE